MPVALEEEGLELGGVDLALLLEGTKGDAHGRDEGEALELDLGGELDQRHRARYVVALKLGVAGVENEEGRERRAYGRMVETRAPLWRMRSTVAASSAQSAGAMPSWGEERSP